MFRPWRLLTAALLVLAGCMPSASSTPSPSGAPLVSIAPSQEPTAEPTDSETPPAGGEPFSCNQAYELAGTIDLVAHVADVRVGTHPGFDRIVFEFIEDGTPDFRIEPASPPFQRDPSDLPMTVNGSDFMLVVLDGGTKLGADGNPTYTGPTEFEPGFPQLVHLVERGDFEAVNSWYVGLANSPDGCFRAFLLSDPSRIVIDIEH